MTDIFEGFGKALNETNAIQRFVCRRVFFGVFQRLGFHITGDHFYETIPNTDAVKRNYQDSPRPCHGINISLEKGELLLTGLLTTYSDEFEEATSPFGYTFGGGTYFRSLDALALYGMIRKMKPQKIIEVGQGFSTRVIVGALATNFKETGMRTDFITIDPYSRLEEDFGVVRFAEMTRIKKPVQSVGLEIFNSLGEGDLLFLDSTHCYKFGSDVEYELEHIVPQVRPGVIIHFHDIFSPFQYPLDWYTKSRRFWNEQHYLEMFLRFNTQYEVILPTYYLTRNSSKLSAVFEELGHLAHHPKWGVSFYVRRVAGQH